MQKAFYITFVAALAIFAIDSQSISADENPLQQLKLAQTNSAEVKNNADGASGDKDSGASSASSSASSSGASKDADSSASTDSSQKAKPSADSSDSHHGKGADASANANPNPNANSNSSKNSNDSQTAGASESKDQVHAWFTQYDGIRRDAEMTLQEKFQVHSLFAKVADDKKSSSGSEKSEELAKKMTDRYAEAAKKIHALPELAATAELQKGYEEFFTRSSHLFHDYLSSKTKGNEKIATREEVQAKREELTAFDKKIKEIDARLRSKYEVRAHRHK
jgi:hypothetical protein